MGPDIFQAVWPILDNSVSHQERIAAATAELVQLATQVHARLTGPPVWQLMPAADCPGFTHHAPGRVLIARAPAVPAGRRVGVAA